VTSAVLKEWQDEWPPKRATVLESAWKVIPMPAIEKVVDSCWLLVTMKRRNKPGNEIRLSLPKTRVTNRKSVVRIVIDLATAVRLVTRPLMLSRVL
jgi:hypothetical protein